MPGRGACQSAEFFLMATAKFSKIFSPDLVLGIGPSSWTAATEVGLTAVSWTVDVSYFCRDNLVTTVIRVRSLPS